MNEFRGPACTFFIADPAEEEPLTIVKRPRVGVAYAKHWQKRLLRF